MTDPERIHCKICNREFDSGDEYARHADRHAGGGESCPIDSAISKIFRALRLR